MIKDRNDMADLMVELLENEISEPDYIPTARGREIINEIADYAEAQNFLRRMDLAARACRGGTTRRCLHICWIGARMRRRCSIWPQT